MHSIDSEQQRESNYAEKESVTTLERRGWAFFSVSKTQRQQSPEQRLHRTCSQKTIHRFITREKGRNSHKRKAKEAIISSRTRHDDENDDDRGCCHLLPSSRTPKRLHQIRRKYILQKRQKKQDLHEMSRMEKK